MAFLKKKTKTEEPMDLDAVMKKYDRESNVRIWEGKPRFAVNCVLAAFSLFCLYVTLFTSWLEELRLTTFVAWIVLLGFLVFPARKGHQKTNYIPWYDIVMMVLGTGAFLYFSFNAVSIIQQGSNLTWYQVVIGIVAILTLGEVCRRSVGLPILIVAGGFLVYALIWGLSNPSFLRRLNYSVRYLFYSKEGIFSTPINVCSKFIVVFIIFGAFLERTGIADFFINISNAAVGGFSGGPAKVAVVVSAMEGMVSGSSVANTVGSGSVTIPLMKKTGYEPEFAAAAEASASTGGQIMPPIMGAAAFLMADYVQLPYSQIVLKAILPAVLYFAGIFISVHLEAKKLGLRGLKREELPKIRPLLGQVYLLLPLVLLIYLVSTSTKSIQYAAAIAIVAAVVVSMFNKGNRITPKRLLEALAAGGQGTITVAAACGIAGIIAGTITMTGLANMLINGIVALAGNRVIIALFLTMICCIVLGMGVPTTANYCIMAATCAPILIRMGVPAVAAHFFVFYFGIVADLTPPVALAAYAGAAIAQGNPMKTALVSTKLAIGAFIVPYVFALNPAMLLVDTNVGEVILISITSLVGIFGVSAALEGHVFRKMPWYLRIASAVGGLMLIYPGVVTDSVGLVLVGTVMAVQYITGKKAIVPAS
ncbi:MAG: TRAP transporter fused permease subunit [Candidatus Faecousia sp.]|nr:TRAP transporter fused permease subunit [Clostridiales bacterium]MDY6179487.1 TRAP transporter fused permease subunit [Candidatus Faecousia sp.]